MKLAKSPKLRYKFIWAKVMRQVARKLLRIYAVKYKRGDFNGLVILLDPETAEPVPFQPIQK